MQHPLIRLFQHTELEELALGPAPLRYDLRLVPASNASLQQTLCEATALALFHADKFSEEEKLAILEALADVVALPSGGCYFPTVKWS